MFCRNCGHTLKPTDKFCQSCGESSKVASAKVIPAKTPIADNNVIPTSANQYFGVDSFNSKTKLALAIIAVVSILGLVGYIIYQNNLDQKQATKDAFEKNLQDLENEAIEAQKLSNLKAVVNIVCDNGNGGSGTIISKEGLVLTNHHVVSGASTCAVTLPDTTTGTPISIYTSKPIIVPKLSEQYDIAMLNINDSFTDDDGKTWGDYPTNFPSYIRPDICDSITRKLGDPIKVYGYPVTSGGSNLTVTEGIISSFADDGSILTSAKIDSGNSGGFAVDTNGCNVGIPTAVIQGQYQNFGVIISGGIIVDFLDEVPKSETFNKPIEDVTPLPQGSNTLLPPETPLIVQPENSTNDNELEVVKIEQFTTISYVNKYNDPIRLYSCLEREIPGATEMRNNVYISFPNIDHWTRLRNGSTPGTQEYDDNTTGLTGAIYSYNNSVDAYNNYLAMTCDLL